MDTSPIEGFNSTPGRVTVRTLDTDGANLGEAEYQLEWVRVGGSVEAPTKRDPIFLLLQPLPGQPAGGGDAAPAEGSTPSGSGAVRIPVRLG